jgi:hypothetical protein
MTQHIIHANDFRKMNKKPRTKKEENLQLQIARYLIIYWPNVIFTSDISGMKLTKGQTIMASRMRSKGLKFPDMLIFEPRGQYKGLFIELKREDADVFQKDGVTPYAGHIYEQWKTLQRLKAKGYFATFGIGFNNTIKIIEDYMKL